MKIRTRISLALMGTGLVATLAFGAVAALAVSGNARSMADSNLASQLGSVGRAIGLFLDQASARLPSLVEDAAVRAALGALPGSPEDREPSSGVQAEAVRLRLDAELAADPLLTEILLADDSGGRLRAPSTLADSSGDARQETWFLDATGSPEGVSIGEPRLASSGATTLLLSTGVRNLNGAWKGALGVRIDATELRDTLQVLKVGTGGFAILTTGPGEIIANPRDITAVGTSLAGVSGGACGSSRRAASPNSGPWPTAEPNGCSAASRSTAAWCSTASFRWRKSTSRCSTPWSSSAPRRSP